MASKIEHVLPESDALERVVALFGGPKILRHTIRNPLDAHELLLQGLPNKALRYFVDNLRVIKIQSSFEKAIGMSLRTYQRRNDAAAKPLNKVQSGKTWKFAEILARATEVFGAQEEAENWLERPAIGLNRKRPIDLLETPAGVDLVEKHLTQLEFGVYV